MSTIEERQHSEIGASGADRWVPCPGSRRLSRGRPNRSTRYAAEGTVAHELAAMCLKNNSNPANHLGYAFKVAKHDGHPEEGGWVIVVDQEMVDGVNVYLDAIAAVKLEDRPGRVLYVIDFKYGAGRPVQVQNNRQLKYYALGAMHSGKIGVEVEFDLSDLHPGMYGTADFVYRNYGGLRECRYKLEPPMPDLIVFGIVQPRCEHPDGPVRFEECHPLDLIEFADELRERARETEDPNAPLRAGDWCDWCPARTVCPELRKHGLEAARKIFPLVPVARVSDIRSVDRTPEQVAEDLVLADKAEAWINATRGDAYTQADAGVKIPGWKIVDKMARRAYTNEKEADTWAVQVGRIYGLSLYEVPQVKSPAQAEAAIKAYTKGREYKERRTVLLEELGRLAPPKSSGTVLVPESDKRPEVKRLTGRDVFPLLTDTSKGSKC